MFSCSNDSAYRPVPSAVNLNPIELAKYLNNISAYFIDTTLKGLKSFYIQVENEIIQSSSEHCVWKCNLIIQEVPVPCVVKFKKDPNLSTMKFLSKDHVFRMKNNYDKVEDIIHKY